VYKRQDTQYIQDSTFVPISAATPVQNTQHGEHIPPFHEIVTSSDNISSL